MFGKQRKHPPALAGEPCEPMGLKSEEWKLHLALLKNEVQRGTRDYAFLPGFHPLTATGPKNGQESMLD